MNLKTIIPNSITEKLTSADLEMMELAKILISDPVLHNGGTALKSYVHQTAEKRAGHEEIIADATRYIIVED